MARHDEKPFWKVDRDATSSVSTEATSGRQPIADDASPTRDDGPGATPAIERGNPDVLRGAIDSGSTGDKVDNPDPAAAPLGTDDEAAGTPPTPHAVATALGHETAGPSSRSAGNRSGPSLTTASLVFIGAVVLIALAMVAAGT